MINKSFAALGACIAISACSTPPKPPTVDDSTKRPVNVSEAVDLQVCRSELSATKVVLAETVANPSAVHGASSASVTFAPIVAAPASAVVRPNRVFVVRFATGSAQFKLANEQAAKLLEQAGRARFIVIRGRTDAGTDSLDETHLAQRRAEAAYNYLMHAAKLPPEGLRVSWQGAGDQSAPGAGQLERQANRRVEIEMYESRPDVEILVGGASTTDRGA
jgi:flagellar motor protein MotB